MVFKRWTKLLSPIKFVDSIFLTLKAPGFEVIYRKKNVVLINIHRLLCNYVFLL